jgi:hypothetical protein
MYAETTNPDFVNPFSETLDDPKELYKKIEAVLKKPRKPVYYEPQWEDPGLHGSGRQAKLRSSKIGRGRLPMPAQPARRASSMALPPMPAKHMSTGELVMVGGVVLGVGALAWHLWKQRQPVVIRMEPTKVTGAGPITLPDWCMT